MDKQTNNLGAQINRAERNWYLGVRASQLHQLTGLSCFIEGGRGRTMSKRRWLLQRGCSIASFKP